MATTNENTHVDTHMKKSLEYGPTRKLLLAEMSLLETLGLEEQQPVSSTRSVLVVELLLLSGVVSRLLAMHLAGQLQDFTLAGTLTALFSDSNKLEMIGKENIKTFHIVSSVLGHVLLVPQLCMLVLVAPEKVTVVLQLVLVILLTVFTALTQGIHAMLQSDVSCQVRGTCMHRSWGWVLFINILLFVTIIGVRMLFHIRWKTWLLSFKVIGSIIEFLVSRKCRDYQALCLLLALSATTISGLVISTDHTDSSDVPVAAVVTDLVSCLCTVAGLLSLVGIYFLGHYSYSHRRVVTQQRLDVELRRLAQEHHQVLSGDRTVSSNKYCPYTR